MRWRGVVVAVLLAFAVSSDAQEPGSGLGSGIEPGQPWVDDGSTLFPGDDRDIDFSDDTPHLTLRDSDTNTAWELHVDDLAADPYRGLTFWYGTQTASGGTFTIGTQRPSLRINQAGAVFLDLLQTVSAARCVELNASGQLTLASAACGTGGGSPGGSDTQVQYNNASAFGGITNFTSNGTNITAATFASNILVNGSTSGTITLSRCATCGTNTINIPAAGGTLAVSATAAATLSAAGDIGVTTSPASAATVVGTGRTFTGGVGIAALGDLSADRTVTLDLTELSTATLGAGAFTTLTFDSGATDPVFTAGNATITLTPGGSDFIVADDIEMQDPTPHMRLTDTTAGDDDWEWSTDADVAVLATTDGTTTRNLLTLSPTTLQLGQSSTTSVWLSSAAVSLGMGTGADQSLTFLSSAAANMVLKWDNANARADLNKGLSVGGTGQSTITQGLKVNNGSTSAEADDFIANSTATASMLEVDAGDNKIYMNGVASTTVAGVGILGADNGTGLEIRMNATQANCTATDIFIDFRSTSGSEGSVACTATGGVVAFNTQTISHWTQVRHREELTPLLLLCSTGEKVDFGKEHLTRSEVCTRRQDPSAYGAYGGTDKEGHDFVLSGGTGKLIVINAGQNLAVGDYLTSSNVRGKTERQPDDLYHNYTVAKCMEVVEWRAGEHEREIAVIYEGG